MKQVILFTFTMLFVTFGSQAGAPIWTFVPLTATTVSVPTNGSATVQYLITNQSTKSHSLAMIPITGVTQIATGNGVCPNLFTLSSHASCVLSLQIDGSQIQTGNTNGPVLCQQGSTLECYKPSASATLSFSAFESQYTVGGDISGLSGTIVLLNNGSDADTITSNGSFTFSTPIAEGSPYNVTVGTQPLCQTCIVTNGSGIVGASNITNISVSCSILSSLGC